MKKLLIGICAFTMFALMVVPVMAVSEKASPMACFGQGRASYALNGDYSVGYWASQRKGENAVMNAAYREACQPPKPTPTPEATRVYSVTLEFGSMGWGGWSCPVGTIAVGGGTIGATQPIVAEGLATANIDGQTYPVYPHYTFSTGETGYVVHNGVVGQSFQIYVDCL